MGVANGRGYQEVGVASGWNLWVWLVSVIVRRYIIDIRVSYRGGVPWDIPPKVQFPPPPPQEFHITMS